MAFSVILAAEIMDLLDSTVINIAAPSIRADIGGTYSAVQWFAAAYTLAFAVGLIIGGRLGDIHGRRTMFLLGATGFTAASAACSLANSPEVLITARVIQGLFGAMLIPQGLGIIRRMFPPNEMAKAFGLFGPIMGLSAVLGPILAGVLVNADLFGLGWRSVFWINVPVGVAVIVGAFKFLPRQENHERVTLDLWGVFIVAVATFALIFPLVQGREEDWPWWTFVMLASSIVMFGVFAWHELRVERHNQSPLVITSLFHKRAFTAGMVFGSVFFAAMSGVFLCIGLYLQFGLGFSPLRAGITTAPIAFGIAIGAGVGGSMVSKLGRRLMLWGLTIMPAGLLLLWATLQSEGSSVSSWQFAPSLLVAGIGMGMVFSPFFGIVLAGVEERETGSAAGTLNAIQQFGGSLGIAVVGTLFFSFVESPDDKTQNMADVFTRALTHTLWLPIAMLVASLFVALLLPKHAREDFEG
jgi:EmrB/QacA subfamily drug resistance transporter